MKKLNDNGFGTLEIIMLVVIVGLLVALGWMFYKNRNKPTAVAKTTTSTQAPATADSSSKSSATAPAQTYLTITEWGVRIKTDSNTKDLYYDAGPSSGGTSLTIYSKTADAITGTGGKSCKGEYLGYLIRYKKGDPAIDDYESNGTSPTNKLADVGDYSYYLATHKQYEPNCFYAPDGKTTDQAAADKFTANVTALRAAAKSLEATQ